MCWRWLVQCLKLWQKGSRPHKMGETPRAAGSPWAFVSTYDRVPTGLRCYYSDFTGEATEQWCAGEWQQPCQGGGQVPICSVCQFPWCKFSHQVTTGQQQAGRALENLAVSCHWPIKSLAHVHKTQAANKRAVIWTRESDVRARVLIRLLGRIIHEGPHHSQGCTWTTVVLRRGCSHLRLQ